MDHKLVFSVEKAFNWSSPERIGRAFARGSLPDLSVCQSLLTPTRLLDLVMRRSLASHRLQCLVDSSFLHPHNYVTMSAAQRGAVPMADMQRLGQLLKDGCTLVVPEVETYDPTIEVACRALQWWSHELVQANAYLTTGDSSGFKLHWDDHDVIVVQVAGEKNWEVRGRSRPVPMFRDARPNPEPNEEIIWQGTMQTGDVMHIPRGYWHRATRHERGDGFSLHVTFGLTKRTGVDWLTWLADQSRGDDLFRYDLDRWDSADRQAWQHRELVEATEGLLRTSLVDYLTAREDQRPAARHVVTHGLFGKPNAVVCVTEFPPRLRDGCDGVAVIASGKEITFDLRALPVLRALLSGNPVDVAKLAAATDVDAAALADVLVEEGICAEVTPEPAGYADLVMPAVV